jgi:maltose alpha-D-glucosyltransferase/alpha-amylase
MATKNDTGGRAAAARRRARGGPLPGSDPQWYKDAIIYELHVKSFFDSDGDGVGDFSGLTMKLDYLQGLGVTALWLLPFYPSPLRDDGYDIADFFNVNPQYGTLADFRVFLREAHARGLRVITELVLNHTSDQHEWFRRSRKAPPGSPWRDYYVWSDTPDRYRDARIIFTDTERSNWTWDPEAKAYFWHRFFSHQPDLNFDNPAVVKATMKVMDFWFGMGVDGMRLDAVPYLYEREGTNCENLPETYAYLEALRAHVDSAFPGRMLLAEANQWPEDAVAYFGKGDRCHMAFHFPVMPRLFMASWMEDRFPVIDIFDQTPEIPANCQWAIFLRNHDELTLEMVSDEERDYMYRMYARDPNARINAGIRRRLAPLLNNNRAKIELMNILLMSLPGTPVIYYGDEILMGDNHYLGDRNGVRTPMQWSADRGAGFSSANPQKLFLPVIIDPDYHYESNNVENFERNRSSMLWWMKRVIAMRKRFRAFSRGSMTFIDSDNPKILSFVREHGDEKILVVVNLSRFSQVVTLDLARYAGHVPEEVASGNKFPEIRESPYVLTLGFHDYFWLSLGEPA